MENKGFLAIIGILIAATLGVIIFSSNGGNSGSAPSQEQASSITETDHVRGLDDSPVTLIEYGDFQCPFCRQYDPIMEDLYAEYGDRVRFVFRHFPLTRLHANALAGHRAAEAASRQGKFFEMAHLIYQQQPLWAEAENPEPILESIAEQLGLDMEKYRADFKDPEVLEKINAQAKTAEAFDITGTPSFVLNGQKITSPASLEEFRQVLDQALAEN